MRVAASGKKTFGEWDQGGPSRNGLVRFDNYRLAERILNADAGGAREDEALLGRTVLSERVVGRVLYENAAEVGFRTEVAGGDSRVERGVGALRRFQWAVATVPYQRQGRNSYPSRLRECRDQVGADYEIAGLHAAIGKAVDRLSGWTARHNALVIAAEALMDLGGAFQALGSEGGDVERVVVKAGKR